MSERRNAGEAAVEPSGGDDQGQGKDAPVIEVDHLSTCFTGQWVHHDISFCLHRGEVLSLIGGSGSGKTVLMHQLIGLLKPSGGCVRVFGEPVHNLTTEETRRRGRKWGVLFQEGALFSAFTVFDNIAFPLRELRKDGEGLDEESLYEEVFLKLEMVGLEPGEAWKFPSELSGGMTKRAALARALAMDVQLLFLDEPTTGLDPISAGDFESLLLELRKDLQLSVFMITHDVDSLAALSDRVAVLVDGRLAAIGGLNDVAQADHPYIRKFFRRRAGEDILRSLPSY